jgi:hypothetical protein
VGIDSGGEEMYSSIYEFLDYYVSFYHFGVLAVVPCGDFIGARCASPFQHFFVCMEGERVVCLCARFTSGCWGTQDSNVNAFDAVEAIDSKVKWSYAGEIAGNGRRFSDDSLA